MDRTIERTFFKTFEFGGTLEKSFLWMRKKYDSELSSDIQFRLPEGEYEKLPGQIKEEAARFDYSLIDDTYSPLMDEISDNLDECNSEQKDRYIYSLLRPFKMYSDEFNPVSEIKRLKGEVDGIRGIKDFERLESQGGKPTRKIIELKELSKACKELIFCLPQYISTLE